MPDVTATHPALPRILDALPTGVKTLVDIGCGRGLVGAFCRIYREPARLVGVDAYAPYLEFCRQHKLYDELVNWRLDAQPLPFRNKEFEVATCIEVIEHLDRSAGAALLDELERVAHAIVVTTPNCVFDQIEYDGNPYQRHVSSWSVADFRGRGYAVYGVGGMKVLGRSIRYVSAALGPVTFYAPRLSTSLLCVKHS